MSRMTTVPVLVAGRPHPFRAELPEFGLHVRCEPELGTLLTVVTPAAEDVAPRYEGHPVLAVAAQASPADCLVWFVQPFGRPPLTCEPFVGTGRVRHVPGVTPGGDPHPEGLVTRPAVLRLAVADDGGRVATVRRLEGPPGTARHLLRLGERAWEQAWPLTEEERTEAIVQVLAGKTERDFMQSAPGTAMRGLFR